MTESKHENKTLSLPLLNEVAIVTGAGRGIGAAISMKLARLGANIVVNDIVPDSSQTIASEIKKLGRECLVSQHDISQYSQANALVSETKGKFNRVDILINNAGITRDSLLHKLSEEKWDEVIRINLKGPFNMGQACAKIMMEQNTGRIVNLASVAWLGNIGQTNYSASKAGVVGMTYTWALELAKYNITVNAIAPGLIDSILTQQIPPEVKAKFVDKIPLKRIGSPEDIANLVSFLVSDQASYITGQCIQIDGGLSVGI